MRSPQVPPPSTLRGDRADPGPHRPGSSSAVDQESLNDHARCSPPDRACGLSGWSPRRSAAQDSSTRRRAIPPDRKRSKIHQIYTQMQVGQEKHGMPTLNQSLYSLQQRRLITLEEAYGRFDRVQSGQRRPRRIPKGCGCAVPQRRCANSGSVPSSPRVRRAHSPESRSQPGTRSGSRCATVPW